MTPVIGEQDIRYYEDAGAICLRGVIGLDWIERLREATERMLAGCANMNKAGEAGNFVGDLNVWQKDPDFRRSRWKVHRRTWRRR